MTAQSRVQLLALLSSSLLPLVSANPANALAINIGGVNYDVFYASTSYNASPDLFSATPPGQMPWWGDAGLASDFAAEVFDQLGQDLFQKGFGAVFAHSFSPAGLGSVNGIVQNTTDLNDQLDLDSTAPLASSSFFSYAYASSSTPPTRVPAPLPLLGVAAAFTWGRRIRKKIKR